MTAPRLELFVDGCHDEEEEHEDEEHQVKLHMVRLELVLRQRLIRIPVLPSDIRGGV